MHLIAPLASGVNGSANGSASILKRGLTSRATYYAAFDGSGAVTPSGDVTLDANGGGIFYVNELVDVVCKDSAGNIVRTFTAGDASPAVEVISQSFTGADYTTGASGASKPTTLQVALDKLKTSFGALDFNVLSGGVSTSMQTAVSNSITSLFFNVKAASYGAIGDGSTDDTTAIAAAITAASAAGGGTVYFPKGTYKITTTLAVPAGVSFLGSGAGASSISCGAAITYTATFAGTVGLWSFVRDLTFKATASNQYAIGFTTPGWTRIDGCVLKAGLAGCVTTQDATSRVVATSCTFDSSTGISTSVAINASTGPFTCIGCQFILPTGLCDGTLFNGNTGVIVGCEFKYGTVTSGTSTIFGSMASLPMAVIGNYFAAVGGAGVPVVNVYAAALGAGFQELGNYFESGYTLPTATLALPALPATSPALGTRALRFTTLSSDAASLAIPTSVFGVYEVVRSTNGAQTITFTDPPGPGHYFTLVYNNNQGATSGTITVGGTNIRGLTSFTVNANKITMYTFKSIYVGQPAAKFLWSLTSTDANESP